VKNCKANSPRLRRQRSESASVWMGETTLGELAASEPSAITDGPFGNSLKTEHYVGSGARVIGLTNIGNGLFLDDDAAYITQAHFAHLMKHQALPGDLVTAALGDPLGRTCIVPENMGLAIVKADCFRFRCHPVINKDYLHGWLNSPQARQSFVERSHGICRLRINLRDYRVTPVLLPPDAEQRRIVAKLDSLCSRSKRARAEIERTSILMNRGKLSILSKAFAGELTEDWRSGHPRGVVRGRTPAPWDARRGLPAKTSRVPTERTASVSVRTSRTHSVKLESGKPRTTRNFASRLCFQKQLVFDRGSKTFARSKHRSRSADLGRCRISAAGNG